MSQSILPPLLTSLTLCGGLIVGIHLLQKNRFYPNIYLSHYTEEDKANLRKRIIEWKEKDRACGEWKTVPNEHNACDVSEPIDSFYWSAETRERCRKLREELKGLVAELHYAEGKN